MFFVLTLFVLLGAGSCFAITAYDNENNADVDLLCETVPNAGDEIEMFDFRTGDYREVYIESRTDFERRTDLVVADSETGEVRKIQIRDFELKNNSGDSN